MFFYEFDGIVIWFCKASYSASIFCWLSKVMQIFQALRSKGQLLLYHN